MFFLEFPCFLYDPANVGNWIAGSSVFSKPSLNIWKFSMHVMLKLNMHDFEHNLTGMGDECNCPVVWTFFSTAILGKWDEDWPFSVQWPLLYFPNLLTYWVQHFDSIPCFKILNSSAGIPLPSLALLTAMLHKAHSTSHSRMSGSGWVTIPSWLSGSLRSFLYSSLYSFHLSWISSVYIRSLPCLSFIVPIFGWNVLLIFPTLLKRSSRNTYWVPAKSLSYVDPMDCSPPGPSLHGVLQARILKWVAMPFSRGSSWPRARTHVTYISCFGRWVLYHWCHLGSPKCILFIVYLGKVQRVRGFGIE